MEICWRRWQSKMFPKLLGFFSALQSACYLLQFMFQTFPLLFFVSSWFASSWTMVWLHLCIATTELQTFKLELYSNTCAMSLLAGRAHLLSQSWTRINSDLQICWSQLEIVGNRKVHTWICGLGSSRNVGPAVSNWLCWVCFLKQVCGTTAKCYSQSIEELVNAVTTWCTQHSGGIYLGVLWRCFSTGHFSGLTSAFFHMQKWRVLQWPSWSPDLNPADCISLAKVPANQTGSEEESTF